MGMARSQAKVGDAGARRDEDRRDSALTRALSIDDRSGESLRANRSCIMD